MSVTPQTPEGVEDAYRKWCMREQNSDDPRKFLIHFMTKSYPFVHESYGGRKREEDTEAAESATMAITAFAEEHGIPFDPKMFYAMYESIVEECPNWSKSDVCW